MERNLAQLIDAQLENDIKELVSSLDDIIADTEDYYELIYDNLPRIERNINLTKEETEILIQYFIDVADKKDLAEQKLISDSLKQIESNLKEINQLLLDQEDINEILNLFLEDDDSQDELSFTVLLELIEETNEVLEEVEIISLNAIIYSAKLGNEAQGFGVISNNIHDISLQLEEEFAGIRGLLDKLSQWHNQFKGNVKNIVKRQDEIAQDYITQVEDLFTSVTDSVQGINLVLKDLLNNVMEVVAPFEELMALIQGQDIIRQNLENIAKSISLVDEKHNHFLELVEGEADLEKEEALDYIYFINKGTTLLTQLGENAFAELFKSLDEIVNKINVLSDSLEEVKNDAENLTNYFYTAETEIEDGLVDSIFADISNFSNQFMEVLSDIKESSLKLNQSELENKFFQLEKGIDNVNTQLDRLNKVEVLARIELARLGSDGQDFGKQIENVVDNVIASVGDNTDSFLKLKDKLMTDLDQFDEIMKGNRQQIEQGLEEVEVSLEELEVTNDIINQAVLALYKEIESLENELNEIYDKLKQTDEIKNKGEEILDLIEKISNKAESEKDKFIAEFEIESWELENDNLKDIVNNLTTSLEIKTVDQFLEQNDEPEDGVEGELTLF